MTAYGISEVEVVNEASGQRYRELAAASIAHYGGRYLARAAVPEVPEGDWPAGQRVVIVEFESMERMRDWYASPEYAEALALSASTHRRRLLFVDGIDASGYSPSSPYKQSKEGEPVGS
jgi:uncharacterized protein (DUF1330 family)